jgi:hypothetical protein
MTEETINKLDPNKESLLELVLHHIDDAMLQHIAALDYGEDVDAHLASLREIAGGVIPIPMGWIPKEVLQLSCYAEPANQREHWMRLFAGMTLLRAAEPPHHEHFHGQCTTILNLVKSGRAIGEDCSVAVRGFLGWCLLREPKEDWLDPYLAIAIMILSVHRDDLSQPVTDYLISVVRSAETEVWELFDRRFCARSKDWKALIRETMLGPTVSDERVRNFGNYLLLESDLAESSD